MFNVPHNLNSPKKFGGDINIASSNSKSTSKSRQIIMKRIIRKGG